MSRMTGTGFDAPTRTSTIGEVLTPCPSLRATLRGTTTGFVAASAFPSATNTPAMAPALVAAAVSLRRVLPIMVRS